MKVSKLLKSLLCSAVMATGMAANPALAVPLTLDELIGARYLENSGDETTLAALEEFAKRDLDGQARTRADQRGGETLAMRDPENEAQWFIDVTPYTPGYFVLKFGTGALGPANNTFFFRNIGELDKLVFSNLQVDYLSGGDCSFGNDSQCNIGRLSHYEYVGTAVSEEQPDEPDEPEEPGTPVPEPASAALLGLGLMGLLLGRHRRQR